MNALPSPTRLLHGVEPPPPPLLNLRAGPLRLLFDPAAAFLRRITLGDVEVLRGIYAAVRDRNWGTAPPRLENVRSVIKADAFTLDFDAVCRQGDIHFVWHGRLDGTASGEVHYHFDGQAQSRFWRNRIGFCVLHPIRECAGAPARQARADGTVLECRFPSEIEPQIFGRASFQNLRAVAHQIAPGLWAEVEFTGDVFEMEDQRNWVDASFKTYCTPLALPFPVEITPGTRIQQSVTLRCLGELPRVRVTGARAAPDAVTVTLPDTPQSPKPALGLGMASHDAPLTPREITRLRALDLSHLRVEVRLGEPAWPGQWQRAVRESELLGLPVELALFLPPHEARGLDEWRRLFDQQPVPLARVLALRAGEAATSADTLTAVRAALHGLPAPVGAGSDANFCELNREHALGRLAAADADFLFWSVNPQVHATDALSVMETLEALEDTVLTARSFAGGKPLLISPLTLKQRWNPVATAATAEMDPNQLPAPVDPRQPGPFAAAWTLGALAALARAQAAAVTLFETTGWRGVMEREDGSPLPAKFPALPGGVFAVYHILADLAGDAQLAWPDVSAPGCLAALACWDAPGGGRHLLLANLTADSQTVHVRGSALTASVRRLAVEDAADALLQPEAFRARGGTPCAVRDGILALDLPPYAAARMDWPA